MTRASLTPRRARDPRRRRPILRTPPSLYPAPPTQAISVRTAWRDPPGRVRLSASCASPTHLLNNITDPDQAAAPGMQRIKHPSLGTVSRSVVQRRTPTQQPGIPAAGPGNDGRAKLAALLRYAPSVIQLGRETSNSETFEPAQSTGADQSSSSPGTSYCLRWSSPEARPARSRQ